MAKENALSGWFSFTDLFNDGEVGNIGEVESPRTSTRQTSPMQGPPSESFDCDTSSDSDDATTCDCDELAAMRKDIKHLQDVVKRHELCFKDALSVRTTVSDLRLGLQTPEDTMTRDLESLRHRLFAESVADSGKLANPWTTSALDTEFTALRLHVSRDLLESSLSSCADESAWQQPSSNCGENTWSGERYESTSGLVERLEKNLIIYRAMVGAIEARLLHRIDSAQSAISTMAPELRPELSASSHGSCSEDAAELMCDHRHGSARGNKQDAEEEEDGAEEDEPEEEEEDEAEITARFKGTLTKAAPRSC